jgi:hypothetical protein
MKKFINSIFTLVVILITQTIAFAQDPSDFGDTTNPNANNLDAPIDTNLWILLLVGLLYVCSKYKTKSKA